MNHSDPKGSPGMEHHARLVQGLSNWQVRANKSGCNLWVAYGVQGAALVPAFLCPVCGIS